MTFKTELAKIKLPCLDTLILKKTFETSECKILIQNKLCGMIN